MNYIEFPNLGGLRIPANPVAISFGKINIYWYGIIIAAGFLLAVLLAMRSSGKFGIKADDIIDLVLVATIPSIIGARLYYVIFTWDQYSDDWTGIFKIWEGGLAIYGAIIGALVSAYIFAKVKKIDILELFDFGFPYFVLAQAIGRWGNFFNQEAFGTNTSLPWGMKLDRSILEGKVADPTQPVHPTFLYESLWDLAVFFTLIWFRKRKKIKGEVFYLYMIMYGFGRMFIESLRTDSLMVGSLRISQFLGAIFVLVFAALFISGRMRATGKSDSVELGLSEYGGVLKELQPETSEEVLETEVVTASDTEYEATEELNSEENTPDSASNCDMQISEEQTVQECCEHQAQEQMQSNVEEQTAESQEIKKEEL